MVRPSTENLPPTNRRRWLQFSLRTLLLFVLVSACLAAWLGYEYRQGRREKEAIAWVERMGGEIEYDDVATRQDWRRKWLGAWYPPRARAVNLGPKDYSEYVSVDAIIHDPNSSLMDISPLAALDHLEELDLSNSRINDLRPLVNLKGLRVLSLLDTTVSDLTPLAEQQSLQELNLSGCEHVSDLSPLAGLSNLAKLDIAHTQVRDLSPLAELGQLVVIDLHGAPVEDLTPLTGLGNLQEICLGNNNLSKGAWQQAQKQLPDCQFVFFIASPHFEIP